MKAMQGALVLASLCLLRLRVLVPFAPPAAPEWVLKLPDAVDDVTFAVQPVGWLGQMCPAPSATSRPC